MPILTIDEVRKVLKNIQDNKLPATATLEQTRHHLDIVHVLVDLMAKSLGPEKT